MAASPKDSIRWICVRQKRCWMNYRSLGAQPGINRSYISQSIQSTNPLAHLPRVGIYLSRRVACGSKGVSDLTIRELRQPLADPSGMTTRDVFTYLFHLDALDVVGDGNCI